MTNLDLAYAKQFENLDYERFKKMALDVSLSPNEKVGFPDIYRKGKELLIWQDIGNKLTNLALPNKLILDIGPGCSQLPMHLLHQAQQNNSKVILCDSKEMLSQLPDGQNITKVEGPFPDCWSCLSQYSGLIDVIIVYSVFHYVFGESQQYLFFDHCLDLLVPSGQLLLGDLPNNSKRARFLNSPAGIEFRQNRFRSEEKNQFDDQIFLALIDRARKKGFEANVLSQPDDLPMANRREDILIVRS